MKGRKRRDHREVHRSPLWVGGGGSSKGPKSQPKLIRKVRTKVIAQQSKICDSFARFNTFHCKTPGKLQFGNRLLFVSDDYFAEVG